MSHPADGNEQEGQPSNEQFNPIENPSLCPGVVLPDGLWHCVLGTACSFPSDIFASVMLNLIKNPNITSSYLFRADVFYDSDIERSKGVRRTSGLLNQLKREYQPLQSSWPGFEHERTIVRQLVPRNPQLDAPLVQTCHFFTATVNESADGVAREERRLVLYMPHVSNAQDVPFYHPQVSQLAFLHCFSDNTNGSSAGGKGTLFLLYRDFPSNPADISLKLSRTALRLLKITHHHGQGQLAGYQKRVNLDRVVPQKRYQDTYTRLKATYAKLLIDQWAEVTDPGKHVFEDLAIAAFLIELWQDLYGSKQSITEVNNSSLYFPGFVDIGCGNGVLVSILIQEGYDGCGFDARKRKTWSTFPENVKQRLQRKVLVPSAFSDPNTARTEQAGEDLHCNGIFKPGTFIISNHADELTAWTPLLAYLNNSAFMAIPCCSHDLSGARSRLPATRQEADPPTGRMDCNVPYAEQKPELPLQNQSIETGSCRRTMMQKKMLSAYSTLCSYVASLADEVGYEVETDTLRIPSTRNHCIIGRKIRSPDTLDDEKVQYVQQIITRELKKSVAAAGAEWTARAEALTQKPGSGH